MKNNRGTIFIFLVIWGIVPLFSSAQPSDGASAPAYAASPGPRIVAHRGQVAGYPENSLSGFEKAIQLGVNYIEVDVRTTADGVLVILHDGDLKRTTRAKGPLKERTFAELQKVVELKPKRRGPKGERIPTLEQVCELLARHNQDQPRPVNLYVDCKDADPALLLNTLQRYGLADGAVFYGGDSYLEALRHLYPQAKIIPALRELSGLDDRIARLEPYGFDVKWKVLNARVAELLQSKDLKIYTDLLFIYDHGRNYKKAQRWGVDVIQTDRAKKAVGAIGQTKAQTQTLKVMTYNIYHGEEGYHRGHSNILRIADLINEYQPDFVALQEVDSMTNRTAAFNGGIPQDLMQELAGLTGMHGYFAKAIDYSNGGYGEGILSRWPVQSIRDTLAIPKGGEGRALISVSYAMPDGRKLIFAGTHLCHQFTENRVAQVQDINKIFENVNGPVIVGGDFNFTPDSESYQVFTSQFLDAARLYGEEKNTFPAHDPGSRIDYIFLSRNTKWKVVEVQVLDTDPSDHLPVLVTLELL